MKLFFISGFFFLFSGLFAQELVTDRPDFTESALVVPAGMVQVESGSEWENFDAHHQLTIPTVLARIGLGHSLEIRAGFGGWSRLKIDNAAKMYLNDLLLEAKYQILHNSEMPLAVLWVTTLPTGDGAVSVQKPEMGLKLAVSRDLNDRLGLGVNLGAISVDTGATREILSLASIALGVGWTNRLSSFLEILAEIPAQASWQPVLDGGVTYLITPSTQADFYLGKGLNAHTADLILGAGFSFRFDY